MKQNKNKDNSKPAWKIWLIKKLLTDYTNKDDVLKILSDHSELNLKNNYEDLDDNTESKLINNIFNLGKKSIEDVMVPRAEILAINKIQSMKSILEIIKIESHSRMPVFEHNLDNILGFVHIKDVIKNLNVSNFNIQNILREVLYVAPKSPILDLLKRMRLSRIHIGLIVDEFGGVDGLVTIEDLVEEIVGEIEDEHDADDEAQLIKKIDDNSILVDASYKIEDLEKYFDIKVQLDHEDDIDTVGGMLIFIANKVPKNNQVYKYKNIFQFKVIKASARRIESLEIKKLF